MERRDFLALCSAPAWAAGGGHNAFGAPAFPLPAPPDMTAYVKRLDSGLERIGRWEPSMGARDGLARSSLQAIFVTGMLGDLPLENQLDPRVQERVFRSTPLFDDAVDGMAGFLSSRTPQDLDRTQRLLRRPGTREILIEQLDGEAERTGVSAARRAQTRQLLRQVTWQLASQPPSLIVGEYLHKVEKVAATDAQTEARQRRLAARVSEQAFWKVQQRATQASGSAAPAGRKKGNRGAKVLGLGLLVFAGGAALAAASGDSDAGIGTGVIAATVGVVMIIVGLVMLLVDAMSKKEAETGKPSTGGKDPAGEPKP